MRGYVGGTRVIATRSHRCIAVQYKASHAVHLDACYKYRVCLTESSGGLVLIVLVQSDDFIYLLNRFLTLLSPQLDPL